MFNQITILMLSNLNMYKLRIFYQFQLHLHLHLQLEFCSSSIQFQLTKNRFSISRILIDKIKFCVNKFDQ